MLKNHGQIKNYEHEIVGGNSRLDSLNAFVLNEKLSIFSKIRSTRNKFYEYYLEHLKDIEWIYLPEKNNSDTVLNYKVEYSKTFQEANGFRTFTVISMDLI